MIKVLIIKNLIFIIIWTLVMFQFIKKYTVSSMGYLGLAFDKNMKWNLYLNNIVMNLRLL